MRLIRLWPDDTQFDFVRFRRVSFPFSAALSVITVILFLTVGLNFGIDFTGGTLIELQAKSGKADIAAVRQKANALDFGEVEVQEFGSAGELSRALPAAARRRGGAERRGAEGPRNLRRRL